MELFILFLTLCILAHIIRTTYELLKIRNKINSENRIVFILIFSNMVVLWISWFNLCQADPYKIALPASIHYLGLAVVALGLYLFFASLFRVRKFENYHGELITNGIYRYLRHPMYLGFICWMAGGALYFRSGTAMIMTIIFTVNIIVWKKLEEVQLQRTFADYKEYMKKTYF